MRPEPVAEIVVAEVVEDDQTVSSAECDDLRAAIEKLGERDKMLLLLRYGEDLTQQAIARRLGLPDGTVKVRLHRLRHRLRKAILDGRRRREAAAAAASS